MTDPPVSIVPAFMSLTFEIYRERLLTVEVDTRQVVRHAGVLCRGTTGGECANV
jgi:hypothetical protein